MATVALRANLYAAIAGRDLVLLDIAAGAYDLIAGIGEHLTVGPSGRTLDIQTPEVRAVLTEAAILGAGGSQEALPLPATPTHTALVDPPFAPFFDRLQALAGWGEMVGAFYGRDLPSLIRRAAACARPGPLEPRHRALARRLARAFYCVSPWIPFQGDCVFRAYMLLRLLQAHGVPQARWVFGVSTWPFYAHCWIQLEEESLSDWHEPLVRFQTIFAV